MTNENTNNNNIKWNVAMPQILASVASYVMCIQTGINLAYSAVLLPQLRLENEEIHFDSDQESWIASILTIALPFGTLSFGPLMNKFGRKKMCVVSCFPAIISWILVATAYDVKQIYVARIFAGIASGLSPTSIVYVSEITHITLRAALMNLNSSFLSLGVLLTYVIGIWCTWRTMAIIFCGISCTAIIILSQLPESPHWLITFCKDDKQLLEKISISLKWIYRDQEVFNKQYTALLNSCPEEVLDKDSSTNYFQNILRIYKQATVYKPTILLLIIFIFQHFSGSYVIIFYIFDIFHNIGINFNAGINEFVALSLVGVIRLIFTTVSSLLSNRFGEKTWLITSGLGMCLSMMGIVLHLMFLTQNKLEFIPLVCLLGYVTFASLGFFVVPFRLMVELYPVRVRATMGGIIITWAYLCMFIVIKYFPLMLEILGIKTVLMIYSGFSLASVGFVFLFLPETSGKTFAEIEDCFRDKKTIYNTRL